MPGAIIMMGNAWTEEATFHKAHGATPQSAEILTPTWTSHQRGEELHLIIGNNQWTGRIVDVLNCTDNQGGRYSRVRAIDLRDELFDVTVFARVNMIDERTGEVWTKLDGGSGGRWSWWEDYEGDKIFPRVLLEWLALQAGFECVYSTEAAAFLANVAGDPWENSRYNVFNMDWQHGIKVGAAIDAVCAALGLQVAQLHVATILTAPRILRFTVPGETEYPGITWDLNFSVSREEGEAEQPDVDTGVWIVGDCNAWEYTKLVLEPAWNQNWDKYWWSPGLLNDYLNTLGLNALVNTVADIGEMDASLIETDFLDGHWFSDLTIEEYITTVPFRTFRVPGMTNVLSPEEYAGTKPVREAPLLAPLATEPSVDYLVYAKPKRLKSKKMRIMIEEPDSPIIQKEGHRLYLDTGHITFQEPQWQVKEEFRGEWLSHYTSDHLELLLPLITVAFKGATYRKFFGTTQRVGGHYVQGLRESYVVPEGMTEEDAIEYVLEGERYADDVAEDIATAMFGRARVVKSGGCEFRGHAGHDVDGEVQRVTVSVGKDGIVERVDFANDEPSPDYDPHLEIRRKLAVDRETKRSQAERVRAEREKMAKLVKAANLKRLGEHQRDPSFWTAFEALSRDNWVLVDLIVQEDYQVGEPVIASPDPTTSQYTAPAKSTIADNDPRFIGINASRNLADGQGITQLRVITTGMAWAVVKGPVDQGDTLKVSEGGMTFEAGEGPVLAGEDVPSEDPELIPVKIGGGGGGGGMTLYLARIKGAYVGGSGWPVRKYNEAMTDETDPDTYEDVYATCVQGHAVDLPYNVTKPSFPHASYITVFQVEDAWYFNYPAYGAS